MVTVTKIYKNYGNIKETINHLEKKDIQFIETIELKLKDETYKFKYDYMDKNFIQEFNKRYSMDDLKTGLLFIINVYKNDIQELIINYNPRQEKIKYYRSV